MYCILVSFVRHGWASCSAGLLTSEAGGFRPAGAKINHGRAAPPAGSMPGLAPQAQSLPIDRCDALSARSLRTTSARRRQAEHNGPFDGRVAIRLAYAFVHVSVPFWPR